MSPEKIARIEARYKRSVISAPGGAVVHFADCCVYRIDFCTCGLLHDLTYLGEDVSELYPKYCSEVAKQEETLHRMDVARAQAPHRVDEAVPEETIPQDYFCLAVIPKSFGSERIRQARRHFEWMDAVHALSFHANQAFDTIDYWNGKEWVESVVRNPRKHPR